jgi:NAD(P)-dependent dehydrogenase (short-subunit alcohol dehydrogenase family)
MRSDGKVAVVTGASQGIGEAVARLFAEQGMRLVLSDLGGDVRPIADDIARTYPESGAAAVVTDITDPQACDALIATAMARHGGVDVLAHATAIPQRKAPVSTSRRRSGTRSWR